jgi:hypothetical protein
VTVKKLVGNLAKDAVVTTASAARHPIGSAARVAGLVKESAGAGLGLMREVVHGAGETEQSFEDAPEQFTAREQSAVPESSAPAEPEAAAPESAASESLEAESPGSEEPAGATTHKTPPGPDIVPKPVPTLDELPEPIVISAQD